jgi:hypothetical protein
MSRWISTILFLAMAASAICAAQAGNICVNPGFELLNPAGDNFPLNWSADKNPLGKSGVVISKDAHTGAIALRLFAEPDSVARVNSDRIGVRRGKIAFFYKAVRSEASGANLFVYAVAVRKDGSEVTRVGASVPKEHVGDGQWHHAEFDFDFTAYPSVESTIIAARINELSPGGAGEFFIDDFECVEARLGPRPVIEALYMPEPIMLTGKPAELAAMVANTGDDIVPASTLRLMLPDGITVASGQSEVHIPPMAPFDSHRVVWQVIGSKRAEFDLGVELASGESKVSRTRHGVCVEKLDMRELCTRSDGFWRFMDKPGPMQAGSAEPLTPLRTLKSSQLPDSFIGITAHIPRSKDFESIFEPEYLIDGDPNTSWSGRAHTTEAPGALDWAQVNFASPADIAEIRLVPYWNAQCFPVDFTVKLRDDGWKTVYEVKGVRLPESDGQGAKKPFIIKLPSPVKADAVRIEVTRFGPPSSFFSDCAVTYYLRLSEIESIDSSGRNVALASAGAKAETPTTFRSYYNSTKVVRDTYKELYNIGVKWNRIGQWGDWTCWAAVERKKGEYYMDPATDRAVTESIANGVNILYTLDYGNPLYQETRRVADLGPLWRHSHPFAGDGGPTKPESIQGFVNYAKFVATHFKGRIKWYEIWNEENSWGWYSSPPDPKAFGTLIRETAKALKEIDPEIKVMVGGTAAMAPVFISQSLEQGGGKYLDAIAFHPYSMPCPEMGLGSLDVVDGKQQSYDKSEYGYKTYREMLHFYRRTMSKYNPNFEYWADEWNAIPTREDSPYRGISEIQEAKHVARFFTMATLTGVRAVWWSLANENTVYDWGVLRTGDLSRKPAYYAIQGIATLLSGARPDPTIKATATGAPPELQCEALRGRDGETLIALWCAIPAEDIFAPRSVSLRVTCGKPKTVDAVDTLHSVVGKLHWTQDGDSIVIPDLNVCDYPLIIRVR